MCLGQQPALALEFERHSLSIALEFIKAKVRKFGMVNRGVSETGRIIASVLSSIMNYETIAA